MPGRSKECWVSVLPAITVCLMLVCGERSLGATIDTLSLWTGGSIDSFGDVDGNNPGATTFGETFVIHGTDALAQNLAFFVRPYYPNPAPQLCTFQVYLMEWSGSRPAGSVLFASAPLTPPSPQTLSISLGNTFLKKDQRYVMFFTSDNFMDGIRSDASMAIAQNAYADGAIVVSYSDPNFNAMFTHDWATIFDPLYDLGFRLDYQPVPEPAVACLLGVGLFAALGLRQRLAPARR